MLTDVRQRRVAELVHQRGSASVPELAQKLGVSEATVRRDLGHLADHGLVERVRGGACRPRSIRPEADASAFEIVAGQEPAEKREIARAAAGLIREGDVVALDIGTTVFAMCSFLRERDITVVTASLAVVQALADAPGVDLVVMGGVLRPNYQSMVGVLTESCLRPVRVDIATRSYLLADHTKFPGSGFLEVAPVTAFHTVITDRPLTPEALFLPPESTLEVLTP